MDDTLNQDNKDNLNNSEVKGSGNLILNIVLVIVILAMAVFGYLFGNFGSISKNQLENEYIKKSQISFNKITASEKMNYIPKDKYLDEIDKLKKQESKIVEKIVEVEKIVYKDKVVTSKPKIVEKIVERIVYKDKIIKGKDKIVYKEKIIESNPRTIEKTVYKDRQIDKSKFNTFRCYGMNPSGYRLTSKCISNLKKFLDKNKSAKYFEVIAVMNPKDFRTIMILEQKTHLLSQLDLNKKQVKTLKNLSSVGLDKLRVVETMWEVKKILGKKTIVVPVSYNVNSNKYRGTVLRAYKQGNE